MPARWQTRFRPWLTWLALALAAIFPWLVPNAYYLYVMSLAYVLVISAIGLNLIVGYAGQLNLAHASFYTIGGYTVGILTADHQVPYWIAFVLAGIVTGVAGFITGLVSLRLKTHYFAIFTLCVGFIIYMVIEKSALTHGTVGIINVPAPTAIGPVSFDDPRAQYYLVLIFLLVALWLMSRITGSLLGRSFIAVRNSENLAEAIGINLMRTKVLAMVISTVYAGLAGGLYAGLVHFLDPSLALAQHNFELLAYILVGGVGTLYGPVIGVVMLTWILQFLAPLQDYLLLIYGPMLILLVMYLPRGLTRIVSKSATTDA